ncbi:hypothetical protein D9615_001691 [Tricholomella constricta]|uniref:Uncharacterized protein n=1 Tax=Tricholomella constricta TaxID=117010 RepID=A0A8H5MAV1_9AGAR|nr:hypothetical protein D9615_001691 [Tricholomella constricta]
MTDEATMEDDGQTTPLEESGVTIEVDMEPYDETHNTEYEMEDGSEDPDLETAEIVDVEVYDASRAHSPDASHGHEAPVVPVNEPVDHISNPAEFLQPSSSTHTPSISLEEESFDAFTPVVHAPADSPRLQTPTVSTHENDMLHAHAEKEQPLIHTENLQLGHQTVLNESTDNVPEEPLLGQHPDADEQHTSAVHDFGASDGAAESHTSHLSPAEILGAPLEEHPCPHGVEAQTQSHEFDPSAVSTDPHEISRGVYIDPPPAVLISVSTDAPSISLFNAPSKSRLNTPSNGDSDLSELVVLLDHLPTLYYEPLSSVFEALRQDEYLGSMLDISNGELLLDAYDLELVMSEDYTFAHELSLHDLNVLHDGLNKPGPLRLRLRTLSPRFIDRYHLLQEQIASFQVTDAKDAVVEPSAEDIQNEDTSSDTQPQLEREYDIEEQDHLQESDAQHPETDNSGAVDLHQEAVVEEDAQALASHVQEQKEEAEGEHEELEYVDISKEIGHLSHEESILPVVEADLAHEVYDPDAPEAKSGGIVEYEQHDEQYGEEHDEDGEHDGDGDAQAEALHDAHESRAEPEDGPDISVVPSNEHWSEVDEENTATSQSPETAAKLPISDAPPSKTASAQHGDSPLEFVDLQEISGEPGSVSTNLNDLPGDELDVITNVDGEPDEPGSSADATLVAAAPESAEPQGTSYDLDPWDDTLDGEGELDTTWEVEEHEHETASNLSSVTLSSKTSTKRSLSEAELEEYEDEEGLPPSSPDPKRPRVQ